MKTVSVTASSLRGRITPPPFKSEVIRWLILSALCGEDCFESVRNDPTCGGDILASIDAVNAAFFSGDFKKSIPVCDSASLFRMLTPLMLSRRGSVDFIVGDSLFNRDIFKCDPVLNWDFRRYTQDGRNHVAVRGSLPSGDLTLSARESSQTVSGLLICMASEPKLRLSVPDPVSKPYIDLTLQMLRSFGVFIGLSSDGFYYAVRSDLHPCRGIGFMPDYSYAANFIAANYISCGDTFGPVVINGRERAVSQADYSIHRLAGKTMLSVRSCPDLFPILCVCALSREHDTVITDISRLRTKESDRVESTAALISSLGGSCRLGPDSIHIRGCGGRLLGGAVDSFGDHRIVMAAAIASLMCGDPVIIKGAEAVGKSAPRFFEDFVSLGGEVNELIRE